MAIFHGYVRLLEGMMMGLFPLGSLGAMHLMKKICDFLREEKDNKVQQKSVRILSHLRDFWWSAALLQCHQPPRNWGEVFHGIPWCSMVFRPNCHILPSCISSRAPNPEHIFFHRELHLCHGQVQQISQSWNWEAASYGLSKLDTQRPSLSSFRSTEIHQA